MGLVKKFGQQLAVFGIAALCIGYFASYVPYSMMTKMISDGLFAGMNGKGFSGFEIQPVVIFASSASMLLFITLARWWKYTSHSTVFGISVPRPQWFTLVSGLCLSMQIITTTLAYTFTGVSIVFAMLLMRGGVLVMAPIVDGVVRRRKRRIYWPSWVASGLSLGALVMAFLEKAGTAMTIVCAVDIATYLFAYFFRLYFMSGRAKSDDSAEKKRFFAEEQGVANIALFIAVFLVGLVGSGMGPETIPAQIWRGFVEFPFKGHFLQAFLIGVFSYGTGLFGTLIFLDKRENTFTVPANRVSSILSGLVASYMLAVFYGRRYPSAYELSGALLIIVAILFLMYRSIIDKRRKASKTAA
ncbi:MAG: hypothetical protein V2A66_01930 [Pseudomonadota bacterium]